MQAICTPGSVRGQRGNLIGTWSAVDRLPDLTGQASQGASQILVVGGHAGAQPVTTGCGVNIVQLPAIVEERHALAEVGTSGQGKESGGSGGSLDFQLEPDCAFSQANRTIEYCINE